MMSVHDFCLVESPSTAIPKRKNMGVMPRNSKYYTLPNSNLWLLADITKGIALRPLSGREQT
ncbi:MAG: hypothetical protein KAI27_00930 [Rhodospirillaceae bacterium]|nr:hypothetical protein [Rhodospirillaceae bacterium]